MKAYTITPKGQVTIPAEIRDKLKLLSGRQNYIRGYDRRCCYQACKKGYAC